MPNKNEIALNGREVHASATPARLLFDSSLSSLPARFGSTVPERHLLFIGPDFDIHVKIAGRDKVREIHGQVIPRAPTEASSQVTLLVQEEAAETKTTERFGEFTFHRVPVGDVAVEICAASRHLVASFTV